MTPTIKTTNESPPQEDRVEFYWALLGEVRSPIWFCRRAWETRTKGEPASVHFDPKWVMDREVNHHDIIGFYHTHPGMSAIPSQVDLATMRAWVLSFGKPLLCAIKGKDGLRAYVFWDDESPPEELDSVEEFKKGIIVAVENCEDCPENTQPEGKNHAEEVSPRRDLQGQGENGAVDQN